MVKFYPDIEFIKNVMRPKPEPGERVLLAFLERYLKKVSGDFEVYFQGKINGYMPDVVIMRKNHGILIIEVKDWNLNNFKIIDEKTWLCIHPKGNDNSVEVRSPIAQVRTYNDEFFKTYSRTLAEIKLNQELDKMENRDKEVTIDYLISKAIFFFGTNETQLRKFFGSHLQESRGVLHSKGVALLTADRLKQGGKDGGIGMWKHIFSPEFFLGDKKSVLFNDEIYNELDRNLRPSEQSLFKYADIKLNAEQETLSKSCANVKEKVRGPAGCGKTLVMAKRAVNAYLRTNEPVLILTFNITLRHYIRDVISAILGNIPKKGKILRTFFIIDNYHHFIKAYRNKNNYLDEGKYNDKWKFEDSYKLSDTSQRKYHSIFVDEIQDFQPTKSVDEETVHSRVDTIHRLLTPGGELVFFGDEEQNIYQNRLVEEKEKYRIYTGIEGDWKRLEKTYRLNGNIAKLARAFQIKFFPEFDDNIIEPAQKVDATIDYYFLGNSDVDDFFANEIFKIFLALKRERKFADDDVCILAQFIRSKYYGPILLKLDKKFRDSGYSTITTFEKLEDYERVRKIVHDNDFEKMLEGIQRTAKLTFQMGSGKIKLSTIHSYKGWGIDNEILILSIEGNYVTREMIYTAITRARKHLVIINLGNTEYDKFFSEYLKREKLLAIKNSYYNVL